MGRIASPSDGDEFAAVFPLSQANTDSIKVCLYSLICNAMLEVGETGPQAMQKVP